MKIKNELEEQKMNLPKQKIQPENVPELFQLKPQYFTQNKIYLWKRFYTKSLLFFHVENLKSNRKLVVGRENSLKRGIGTKYFGR